MSVADRERRILEALAHLDRKVGVIMAALKDLTTLLTNISADVDTLAAHEKGEPGGGVVTQAQLDGVVAQAQAIKDKTAALIGGLPVPAPMPVITSLTPASGAAGETVTITGTGFGSAPGSVQFAGSASPAPDITWSDTSITVKVPADAASGSVTVKNAAGVASASFTKL